jgi:hypothetical protein
LFIPDPDPYFLPIPDPESRGQKGTGSRILDPDPQHWLQVTFVPRPPNIWSSSLVPVSALNPGYPPSGYYLHHFVAFFISVPDSVVDPDLEGKISHNKVLNVRFFEG